MVDPTGSLACYGTWGPVPQTSSTLAAGIDWFSSMAASARMGKTIARRETDDRAEKAGIDEARIA
jgi:hypothetical protein